MKYPYPRVRVRGVVRCDKIKYRTRTRVTRFGNTVGFSIPVLNPIFDPGHKMIFVSPLDKLMKNVRCYKLMDISLGKSFVNG